MSGVTYLPSSSERKRVIMAYLLVGLLFFSQQEDLSIFEYFHYKQSVGWFTFFVISLLGWILTFVLVLIFGVGFLAIIFKIFSWIFAIPLFFAIILWGFLVLQGWRGEYLSETSVDKRWKLIFVDFGGRVLGIFGVTKKIYGDISLDSVGEISRLQGDETT